MDSNFPYPNFGNFHTPLEIMKEYLHPSIQISNCLKQIYHSRLTTTSGGNISVRSGDQSIWITPAGIDKGSISTEDIVQVNQSDRSLGRHKPSSELPFHKAIYQKRNDIKAIIHAHPPNLVSFSIVGKLPNTSIIPQAKQLCGNVGFAKYQLPGSKALGESIALEFEKGFNTVIMENHGIVIGGKDLSEAFMRFETLEFCAKTLIKSAHLGKAQQLTEKELQDFESLRPLIEDHEHKHPSDEELWLRNKMASIIQRSCNQGLMISSFGTISARVSQNQFLINPTGFNRRNVTPGDFVLVENNKKEKGKLPSRATRMHEEIYKNHPDINAIISTQSPYIMAFSITHTPMDTRTIPESYVLLEDIPLLPYGDPLERGCQAVKVLGKHTPIAIFKNNSVLVTGTTLIEAFDRLEVAEFSAVSLIESRVLGSLKKINNSEISELRKKFLED